MQASEQAGAGAGKRARQSRNQTTRHAIDSTVSLTVARSQTVARPKEKKKQKQKKKKKATE